MMSFIKVSQVQVKGIWDPVAPCAAGSIDIVWFW